MERARNRGVRRKREPFKGPRSEDETCKILKNVMETKIAEAARMSPPAGARAHGKSSDLTIWATPHSERENRETKKRRRREHVGRSFVSLLVVFFWREGRRGRVRSLVVSSFFHLNSVLPGMVQFLDS